MVELMVVLSLALLALGVGLYSAWEAWHAVRSRHWPAVVGRIVLAGVEGVDAPPTGFRPRVRYQYTVNGTTYESTRLRFGGVNPWSVEAVRAEMRGEILAGTAPIYYDPRDPKRSCLTPGCNEWTLAVPAMFLVMGIALLVGVSYSMSLRSGS